MIQSGRAFPYDVQIALCGYGETKDETTMSLLDAVRESPCKITVRYLTGDALIGRSRSIVCTRFLEENLAPYMVFIDTDIAFTPLEMVRLIQALQEGYDIIGGACGLSSGNNLNIKAIDYNTKIDGGIYEVQYIGCAFLGISRNALLTIKDKLTLPLLHKDSYLRCYPFFESGRYMPELLYISEDWDFCNKARQAGFKIYLHTGVLVDHIKSHTIRCEDVIAKKNRH
jgi:GT2 family glycosyltransferase